MKTEDMMVIKRKVYNTPELVEHGSLNGITHGQGNELPLDAYPSTEFPASDGVY